MYFRVSCPSRLPGTSSIPLLWQLPTLAHPHCWPQISSSWCKADHCRLCPWVYTWAVGSILIQIVSVPLRNKKGEHNTRAAELSVLIRATHHLLWLEVLSAPCPCSQKALDEKAGMVNGGSGAGLQRKLDTDAHLGKSCTGISGRKKQTLEKKITVPYKRCYRTLFLLEISDPLTAEKQGMARPLVHWHKCKLTSRYKPKVWFAEGKIK